jgi:hypothetical protein
MSQFHNTPPPPPPPHSSSIRHFGKCLELAPQGQNLTIEELFYTLVMQLLYPTIVTKIYSKILK